MSDNADPIDQLLEWTRPPLVHIGYPKALSTWLQRHMFMRRRMRMRTIMEPMDCMLGLIDVPPLEFSRSNVQPFFSPHDQWRLWMHNCIPVITGENLAGAPMAGGYDALTIAERIKACFPQARILIIVREQQKMLRSLYSSFVSTGGLPHSVSRLLDPVNPRVSPQFSLSYLRYHALVSGYQRLFGAEQVLVLPMEMFISEPHTFASKILEHAGPRELPDTDALPITHRTNTTHRLLTLHLLRWSNRYFTRTGVNPRGLKRYDSKERLFTRRQAARYLDQWLPRTPLDNWLEKRFARKTEAIIGDAFSQSNRQLQEITGLDLERYGYRL